MGVVADHHDFTRIQIFVGTERHGHATAGFAAVAGIVAGAEADVGFDLKMGKCLTRHPFRIHGGDAQHQSAPDQALE